MAKIAIKFDPPERMNLLGYILRASLLRSQEDPRNLRRLQKLRKPIEIGASGMSVNVVCEPQGVILRAAGAGPNLPKPCVRVRGDLQALLGVSLRRGMVKNFLRGRLRFSGRVWRLLPLLSLLKAKEQS